MMPLHGQKGATRGIANCDGPGDQPTSNWCEEQSSTTGFTETNDLAVEPEAKRATNDVDGKGKATPLTPQCKFLERNDANQRTHH